MFMIKTFLHYERFRFERADCQSGLNWSLIVALVLNFGVWIGACIVAWRCS
jgi:hypothetical protein